MGKQCIGTVSFSFCLFVFLLIKLFFLAVSVTTACELTNGSSIGVEDLEECALQNSVFNCAQVVKYPCTRDEY